MKELYKEIEADELYDMLQNGEKLYLIDVREDEEWIAGHIKGAIHIPLGQIPARINEIAKDKEVYMICRSGNRSGLASEYLAQYGFKTVNMAGGMLDWPGEIEKGR